MAVVKAMAKKKPGFVGWEFNPVLGKKQRMYVRASGQKTSNTRGVVKERRIHTVGRSVNLANAAAQKRLAAKGIGMPSEKGTGIVLSTKQFQNKFRSATISERNRAVLTTLYPRALMREERSGKGRRKTDRRSKKKV